ncbi:MAG: Methionine-tRNA ligase [Parcubacteria group bacterium GW2011_GWF2_38_76]|nr:MAG: Methionine-tRNA ligase [Parcubacteria group bacterium GW2011_GWF2_38_76]HBM45745.1 methionine--tRNA ligase subunit beta [Patescibacteria group bacterium]
MTIKQKPNVSYDDFLKLDLRVGTIVSADDLENSNKLIKMIVDDGGDKRQIIAGIKKQYKVEDLVGKQVVFIANLEPREIAGLVSNGMILASHTGDDLPVVLIPERAVPDGSQIS